MKKENSKSAEAQPSNTAAQEAVENGNVSAEPVAEDKSGATPEETSSDNGDELTALRQELAEVRQKADEYLDLAKRVQADAENEKKRAANRIEQERKYVLQDFIKGLLEVKDNLERGLQDGDHLSFEGLREGVDLTLKSFAQALERSGVEELNPVGEPFDPKLHEAVGMEPSASHPPNTVIAVMQKGYRLNERLLRAAMVTVAQAVPEDDGADT